MHCCYFVLSAAFDTARLPILGSQVLKLGAWALHPLLGQPVALKQPFPPAQSPSAYSSPTRQPPIPRGGPQGSSRKPPPGHHHETQNSSCEPLPGQQQTSLTGSTLHQLIPTLLQPLLTFTCSNALVAQSLVEEVLVAQCHEEPALLLPLPASTGSKHCCEKSCRRSPCCPMCCEASTAAASARLHQDQALTAQSLVVEVHACPELPEVPNAEP
jgi:hypothetical protein